MVLDLELDMLSLSFFASRHNVVTLTYLTDEQQESKTSDIER